MKRGPKCPFSVSFCNAMVNAASHLIPAAQRSEWKREWLAEIWHRWQFLQHSGEWNRSEGFRLIANCAGMLPDAAWHFTAQDAVQIRTREVIRSPWSCLGGCAAALLGLAIVTSGLPATRTLVQYQGSGSARLLYIWFHSSLGGRDNGLPADLIPAWQKHSHLLESLAPFTASKQVVRMSGGQSLTPLVVAAPPSLFRVLHTGLAFGEIPRQTGVVITDQFWRSIFHEDRNLSGKVLEIGTRWYAVTGVLPRSFQFLSRQPEIYLVKPTLNEGQPMAIARLKAGISEGQLDEDLVKIAEHSCAYDLKSELRYGFLARAALIPVQTFGVAVFAAALLAFLASGVRMRHIRCAFRRENRLAGAKRCLFFSGKTGLALLVVFLAGLEWSRSESAVILGSSDPAGGPFLLWLYILCCMGVMFWSVADQRARCRVCLRLLCFPVRVGCPGCLLLDWSGTELLCTEGHGMLHVPDLAPSWDERAEHWIEFDESWKGLFAPTR